jgi:predicted transcriptional regulator
MVCLEALVTMRAGRWLFQPKQLPVEPPGKTTCIDRYHKEKQTLHHNFPFFLFCNLIGCGKLSLERVFKALVDLGLSETDAQVYIYLATKGPAKASNIIHNLTVTKRQIYRSLKWLQNRSIIIANDEHPVEFSTLPFEEVLDMLIEMKHEQAQAIKKRRKELLSSWLNNKK